MEGNTHLAKYHWNLYNTKIKLAKFSQSYQYFNILFTDQGTYTCVATNKNGQAESTGRLIVVRGPSFQGGRTKKPNPRRIVNIEDSVEVSNLCEN